VSLVSQAMADTPCPSPGKRNADAFYTWSKAFSVIISIRRRWTYSR